MSAISAAALLPVATDAEKDLVYAGVATYLNKDGNQVPGQQPDSVSTQLHDGNLANGEVIFSANPDTGLLDTMRVVAPSATCSSGSPARWASMMSTSRRGDRPGPHAATGHAERPPGLASVYLCLRPDRGRCGVVAAAAG